MKTFDLVGARNWFFAGSALLVVVSLVLLVIPPALRPGIEFTSGTTMHLVFPRGGVAQDDLRSEFASIGYPEARVQSTAANAFLVRIRSITGTEDSSVQTSFVIDDVTLQAS